MSNSEVDELASMFKQQVPKIFSDSGCYGCGGPNVKLYMGRLVCDDCEAVNGSYIDSLPEWRSTPADGSKHTERCGVVGSDLYTSSIWGA
jgi:transcription initiation factor TFIIIB Brf1 subunit/transcription initiation factor TFIIB